MTYNGMKYFIAVKRKGMKFHAQHGPPIETTNLEEFLSLNHTKELIAQCKLFKDDWRVMEWVEDPKLPHKVIFTEE